MLMVIFKTYIGPGRCGVKKLLKGRRGQPSELSFSPSEIRLLNYNPFLDLETG